MFNNLYFWFKKNVPIIQKEIMRKIFTLILLLCVNLSCKNSNNQTTPAQQQKDTIATQQTDTIFNGEYLKIQPNTSPQKDEKQSLGGDYFSMGHVNITLNKEKITIVMHKKSQTVLAFSKSGLNALVQGVKGNHLHIHFTKSNIIRTAKGSYPIDKDGKLNPSMLLTLKSNEKIYNLIKGHATLIDFLPRTAHLQFEFSGIFKDQSGQYFKGNGTIDMNFGRAVMTPE